MTNNFNHKTFQLLLQVILLLTFVSCRFTMPSLFPEPAPPTTFYRSFKIYNENLQFDTNQAGAKITWKKNIGSLMNGIEYLVGSDVDLLADGRIYYQTMKSIRALDAVSGKILDAVERPQTPPSALWDLIDIDHICYGRQKTYFPMIYNAYEAFYQGYLQTDNANGNATIIWNGGTLCRGGYSVLATNSGLKISLAAADLNDSSMKWRQFSQAFSHRRALDIFSNHVIFIYSKHESLFIDSYDLSTGTLIWTRELPIVAPLDDSIYEATGRKHLISLQGVKSILVSQHIGCDLASGEIHDTVTSLDPETGEINWQKSNILNVFTKRYDEADNLFYFMKEGEPDIIYGIDQKTGTEKLRIHAEHYDPSMGIVSTPNRIFFGGQEQAQGTRSLYVYNPSSIIFPKSTTFKFAEIEASKDAQSSRRTFSALDKKSGTVIWTISLHDRFSLPIYDNGILYFGNKPDFYKNMIAGSIRHYEHMTDSYRKDDVQEIFTRTAFAVDAETGKKLWQIGLDGGNASYIEKLFINGRRVYILSFTGWLYAFE